MSLHADLLRQARQLALKEPRRPLQASLRRAISASYYALFHLLVDEATKRMFPGGYRAALRGCLARAFLHGDMKKVAQQFSEGGVSPKLSPGMNGQAVQPELMERDGARQFHALKADLEEAVREAAAGGFEQFDPRGLRAGLEPTIATRSCIPTEAMMITVRVDVDSLPLIRHGNAVAYKTGDPYEQIPWTTADR